MAESDDTAAAPERLTAAGGFCAPSQVLYDVGLPNTVIGIPEFAVQRGLFFQDTRTDAEKAADSAFYSMVTRIVDAALRRRAQAVDAACRVALAEGWDVHVYDPPDTTHRYQWHEDDTLVNQQRYVGIEFTPAKRSIPTVHEHGYADDYYDWDED